MSDAMVSSAECTPLPLRASPRLSHWKADAFVIALMLAICPLGHVSAAPSGMRRIDPDTFRCEDYLVQTGVNQSWQDMMEIEHCDRIKRLLALTQIGAQPEFFVEHIPADRLPAGFKQSMPLLRVVFPQRVFFDTAKAELRPEGMDVVRVVAENLRRDVPDVTLFVAGHTDPRGNRDYNQNLSVDRANAVAAEILRQGVNLATVWRIGFGPDMPAVPNDGPTGWGYNRRVEFLFAAKPEAIATWLADMQLDGLCSGTSRKETDACRHSLDLRSDYEAVQILAEKPTIAPPSGQGRALKVPNRTGVAINPQPGRRIVINPINRTATANITIKGNTK